MNGEINVESQLGHGSTFTATIQVHKCCSGDITVHSTNVGKSVITVTSSSTPILNQKLAKAFGEENITQYCQVSSLSAAHDHLRENPCSVLLLVQDEDINEQDQSSLVALQNSFAERFQTHDPLRIVLVHPFAKRRKTSIPKYENLFSSTFSTPLPQSFAKDCFSNQHTKKPFRARSLSSQSAESRSRFSSCSVLVVDDNMMNQRIFERMLSIIGVETIKLAGDGSHALRVLEEKKGPEIDVIFMDVSMPIMDGQTCTREIRKIEERAEKLLYTSSKRVPIIAITANVTGSDRDMCIAAGMDLYMPKVSIAFYFSAYVNSLLTFKCSSKIY
jgi:CheY-like chemotaxis protein